MQAFENFLHRLDLHPVHLLLQSLAVAVCRQDIYLRVPASPLLLLYQAGIAVVFKNRIAGQIPIHRRHRIVTVPLPAIHLFLHGGFLAEPFLRRRYGNQQHIGFRQRLPGIPFHYLKPQYIGKRTGNFHTLLPELIRAPVFMLQRKPDLTPAADYKIILHQRTLLLQQSAHGIRAESAVLQRNGEKRLHPENPVGILMKPVVSVLKHQLHGNHRKSGKSHGQTENIQHPRRPETPEIHHQLMQYPHTIPSFR